MKRAFIIHGWQGMPGNHWKGWLKKKLESDGIEVIEPVMRNDSWNPADWIQKLQEVVGNPDDETLLIWHSLGCPTIIGYLMQLSTDEKIGWAILVAGFSSRLPWVSDLDLWDFDPIEVSKAKNHCDHFVHIMSDNDSAVPAEKTKELHDVVGGELIIEHNKWHFCEEDGVTGLQSVYDSAMRIFWL